MKLTHIMMSALLLAFVAPQTEAAVSEKGRKLRSYKNSSKQSRARTKRKVVKKRGATKEASYQVPAFSSISDNLSKRTIMALRLPRVSRINSLRSQGEEMIPALAAIAFNPKETLQVRWRAVTSLGEAFPKQARPIMSKALSSREWYMRNAGLIGMTHISRSRSLSWAGKLLNDPALVVRTAAVKTISKLKGHKFEGELWRKLYSKENYSKGKSLWIRKHIVATLSQFAKAGREPYFMRVLSDKDQTLHPYAISALESIHGKRTAHLKSTKDKRVSWMRWWRDQLKNKSSL